MFRFEDISFLYGGLVIPMLILLYLGVLYWRKRSLNQLGEKKLITRLAPDLSTWKRHFKFVLLMLGLILLIFAGANPQWGSKKEKIKAKSADIFIALDISQSMMTEDISPNRLERSKRFVQRLIRALKGERIGLIYFAGNAYLQIPLTLDYAAAELFVRSANTLQASTQGTAIAEAIEMADLSFIDKDMRQRALVVITDGEDHDEGAIERATQARENGTLIYTVGVGTETGGFIPYTIRGREQYKKDKDGNPVKSKINVEMIQDVAEAGGGKSYLIQEGQGIIEDLKKQMSELEKQEIEQRSFSEYASYFQYFLLAGILFLIVEFIFSERGTPRNRKSIFEI